MVHLILMMDLVSYEFSILIKSEYGEKPYLGMGKNPTLEKLLNGCFHRGGWSLEFIVYQIHP